VPGPITIRPATVDDCSAINDIYNHYVLTDTCTYQTEPDTLAERQAWFARHGGAHRCGKERHANQWHQEQHGLPFAEPNGDSAETQQRGQPSAQQSSSPIDEEGACDQDRGETDPAGNQCRESFWLMHGHAADRTEHDGSSRNASCRVE